MPSRFLVHLQFSSLLVYVHCVSIPFISNVTLVPRIEFNTTIIQNCSIAECLCRAIPSFVAFNWFSNRTCELFATFPITYKYRQNNQSRLYFAQGFFPIPNKCCMPDLNYLLKKLNNGQLITTTAQLTRNLILDDRKRLLSADMPPVKLLRFHPQNLTLISQTNISGSNLMAIAFNNGFYFAAFDDGVVVVIDSGNLSVVRTIDPPFAVVVRGITFVNQGRTMVIGSYYPSTLLFYNQIGNASSTNYNYSYQQVSTYPGIHGLTAVNDTYFYATSYTNKAVYAYKANANNLTWTETLLFNSPTPVGAGGAAFVSVDDCGRYWLALESYVVLIFDNHGVLLGNFSLVSSNIIHTLITDNYVMFFSDRSSNNRIVRIDPHIEC